MTWRAASRNRRMRTRTNLPAEKPLRRRRRRTKLRADQRQLIEQVFKAYGL